VLTRPFELTEAPPTALWSAAAGERRFECLAADADPTTLALIVSCLTFRSRR
jgi:hypothetical protein